MAMDCSEIGNDETDESEQFTFGRVGVIEDDIATGSRRFEDDGPQPTPVTRCRNDFFSLLDASSRFFLL